MCLVLPGLVVERDGDSVSIATDGRIRRASTVVVPEVQVGDWVVVGAGTVLRLLTATEAATISAEIHKAEGEVA